MYFYLLCFFYAIQQAVLYMLFGRKEELTYQTYTHTQNTHLQKGINKPSDEKKKHPYQHNTFSNKKKEECLG